MIGLRARMKNWSNKRPLATTAVMACFGPGSRAVCLPLRRDVHRETA